MKETITIVRDHGDSGGSKSVQSQGRGGDNQLAHVNPWEAALLKALGGSGTTNPKTGLKEFANPETLYTLPYSEDLNNYAHYTPGSAEWVALQQNGTQNYGKNADLNKWLSSITGYTGDYGSGGAMQDATARGFDLTALKKLYPDTSGNTQSDMFNFPTDIMPTSKSSNNTYSGLPTGYQDQLLSALMPQLQTAITNMPGNIDTYTNQAQSSYQALLDNALKTQIPKTIGNLANRGIINSTEGSNAIADVTKTAMQDAANKQYTTAMQSALLKANMPSVLSNIADLGKSTTGTSTSLQQDPTQMYQIMANLIQAMM